MAIADSSAAPALRGKVSTGYGRLDEALQGGFLAGSATLLSAPASNEVPILMRNFLRTSNEASLLICRSQSSAEAVSQPEDSNLKCLICSEKPIPPSKNMLPGKSIDNLTELNFQITEILGSIQPKRVAIEILSDILLRHKALQTRKWLNEFLEKLRVKNVTTLAVLNPYMHADEEVQAVVDLFDGNLEIVEKEVEGQLQKFLRVKWMHAVQATERELPLLDLTPERVEPSKQPAVVATHFKEPKWLTSLVGRTAELSKLKIAFENAVNNSSSVVALQGEEGVGKTRLMQELAVYSQAKNAVVLSGSALEEKLLPYAPWVEAARQYVAQAPGELLRRMLGSNASELVKLVPDLAAKLGTIPPPRTTTQDKTQFYEAVTQFFISICSESPLVFLFDDMQWADQPSLDLLEYFVRSATNQRVLTACAYRSEDLQSEGPPYQSLMNLNRQRLLETLQVRNLSKDETIELIKRTFGEQTITPEFADLIYGRTGGNPFFIEEVLRSLVEDGTIFRTETKWDRKPIQEIVLPASVKSVLKSRLTKLQPETLNALTMASVIGSEFDLSILREVTQIQEDALLDQLKIAVDSGLIQEIPGRDAFRFSDNRIRELLLDDVLQSRRRRHHIKIAEAIEKTYSKNIEGQAEVIASHFSEAGDTERTIKYSMMAGDRNRTIHAYEQAIGSYQRALSLVDAKQLAERASLLEKLGDTYDLAGQHSNMVESYQNALNLQETLHDYGACARISNQLASGLFRVKGLGEAVRFLKDAMKYVHDNPDGAEAAGLYGRIASYLAVLDRYDEANEWSQRALEAGKKSGNHAATSEALSIMGSFFVDRGRIDEGLPLLERSLEVAKQHNLNYQTQMDFLNLANNLYPRDLLRARDYASQWLVLAKQENDLYMQANATVHLAFFDWLRGNWAQATEEMGKAFEIKGRLGFRFVASNAEAWYAQFYLGLGELGKAEEYCRLALERHDEQIYHVVAANLAVGKLRLEEGRVDDAKAHFEASVNAFKDHEFSDPYLNIETMLQLTSIYLKLSQPDEARRMLEWAKRLAETLKSDANLAMAVQAEAAFLFAKGEGKGVEEAYLNSLTLWEKAGWPYYRAKALVAYSEAIAQTNPEESKKRLQQAAEIFRKLGAKRDLEKAESRLQS